MSWDAVTWARQQRCATPSAQLVLLLLADWASPEGTVAVLRAEVVAEDAIQSRANVFRHLSDFEEAGILTRTKVVTHGGGVVLGAQLHLDKGLQMPRRTRAPLTPSIEHPEEGDNSDGQNENGPESQIETRKEPENESHPAHLGDRYLRLVHYGPDSTRNKNLSEAAPSAFEREEDSEFAKRLGEDVRAFMKAYPFDGSMSVTALSHEMAKLTYPDRKKAIRWAPVYGDALKDRKKAHAVDAAKWVRQREFDGLAALAQAQAEAAGHDKPQFTVYRGTEAGNAWDADYASRGEKVDWIQGRSGYMRSFPSLFPPKTAPAYSPPSEGEVEF